MVRRSVTRCITAVGLPAGNRCSSTTSRCALQPKSTMLTYGASLEEVPPVKEIILEVRMAYMELNHEAIALIENKNKVSLTESGSFLPQASSLDLRK